ncbi:hypothetical protein Nepgr_009325 [Nepenthes gracilis]|uniref:Uncharacterized protein n=1 Tax=Nepenthes gracilis TaxID=150966 RepID=A0AAD3XK88_NEPGR|nr:hypothetical protein Nepgr_009325 [Nepenthes gracilis]
MAGPSKGGPGDSAAHPPPRATEEGSCSLLESSSSGDEDAAALKRLREAEGTSLRRSKRRVTGPSIVGGSPAPKRPVSAGHQGETAKPSSTSIAGLAAREVCEVESLPAGDPPTCSAVEVTDDVVVLEGPEGPFATAPEPASEARGPVESLAILVKPISEYRPPEDLDAPSEVGAAPAADPVQAEEGEAGTSSWQEPPSVPTAASPPVSPPPAGEGAEPQGEALPGDLAHSPSAAVSI